MNISTLWLLSLDWDQVPGLNPSSTLSCMGSWKTVAFDFLATTCRGFVCLLLCNFSPYSTIFPLFDGDQGFFLLVEEGTQIHYTMYLGRDHRPSASKLTNFPTQSPVRAGFEPTGCWLEVRDLVVWYRCLNHSVMLQMECDIILKIRFSIFGFVLQMYITVVARGGKYFSKKV
jgi:hypothetical protein